MKKNNFITLLLVIVIIVGGAGFIIFNRKQGQEGAHPIATESAKTTNAEQDAGWKTYGMKSASFSYPSNILFTSVIQSEDNVVLTNQIGVDSPLGLTDDGIWIEATIYPSTAKNGLIKDVQQLITAENGSSSIHPITPYPEQFVKQKNLDNGGVLLSNPSATSGEIETALWNKNDFVYQLRIVVSKRSTFEDFDKTFEKMAESFSLTN